MITLNKPLEEMTEEELSALCMATPAGHPYGLRLKTELERRMALLLASAPTPELRALMEETLQPGMFQQFLSQDKKAAEEYERFMRMGSEEMLEDVVQEINAINHKSVTIRCDDIWNAWPAFVQECYGGMHPDRFAEVETYLNDFVHWMITSKNHEFYRVVGDKEGTAWLRQVAEIYVNRRILEWKYIQLTEHGIDLFADPETRDKVLKAAAAGEFRLWDSVPEEER
jgi:hypothetical protein